MSLEDNKQLVLHWKAERNHGKVDVVDDLCTPNCVLHMSGLPTPGPVRGRAAFKHLFAAYLAAFALQSMPEFLLAEGDLVAIRETYRLTHKGEFQGIAPTGKDVSVTGTEIYRIVDGKFVEQWVEADMLGLMRASGRGAVTWTVRLTRRPQRLHRSLGHRSLVARPGSRGGSGAKTSPRGRPRGEDSGRVARASGQQSYPSDERRAVTWHNSKSAP